MNNLSEQLFKLTGTKHNVTSAYHPQSNRLCDRTNQTLERALLKVVNELQVTGTNIWTPSCLHIGPANRSLQSIHHVRWYLGGDADLFIIVSYFFQNQLP